MSTPVGDPFSHHCADAGCFDRDHWQLAARNALVDLDTTAMTAVHYMRLTAELSVYPRKSAPRALKLVKPRSPRG